MPGLHYRFFGLTSRFRPIAKFGGWPPALDSLNPNVAFRFFQPRFDNE